MKPTDVAQPEDLEELPEDLSTGTRTSGNIRSVVVDREGCIGARSCAIVADKLFAMDDQDLAYILPEGLDSTDEETIKMAAESCPVLAIHLYGEDGKKLFPEQ